MGTGNTVFLLPDRAFPPVSVGKSLATAGLLTTGLCGESHANPFSFKFGVLFQTFPIGGHLPVPCKMGTHAHKILLTLLSIDSRIMSMSEPGAFPSDLF